MLYDMPNAMIDDIIDRMNSESIPCNTTWVMEQVMETNQKYRQLTQR